jgi:hypothetical protein
MPGMSETNITSTDQAAALIQSPTTRGWADDSALNRCVVSHVVANVRGDVQIRCEAQAGHAGNLHQSHDSGYLVRWTED